jgi:hypothetical protein
MEVPKVVGGILEVFAIDETSIIWCFASGIIIHQNLLSFVTVWCLHCPKLLSPSYNILKCVYWLCSTLHFYILILYKNEHFNNVFLVVYASVQLPPPQLEAALNRIAALKAPLIAHASQPDIQSSLPRFINHSAQKCCEFYCFFPLLY